MGTHFHEHHDDVARWSWRLFCAKWARLMVQVARQERDRRDQEREREGMRRRREEEQEQERALQELRAQQTGQQAGW